MLVALTIVCCFDALHAQESRIVVLSKKVGTEIDKDERNTYRLFPEMKGFHSASVRHAGDSSFVLFFRLDDGAGGFRDSLERVSFRSVSMLAEKIDYHDSLMNGRYVPGTGVVQLHYADGSAVVVPDFVDDVSNIRANAASDPAVREAQDDALSARPRRLTGKSDRLPLAPNKQGLRRPMFRSFEFALSMDYMSMDIGEIESLPGEKGSAAMGLSVKLGVVLVEEPTVRLLGGWTFFLGHELTNYSLALLWQPISFGNHGPLLGIGGGWINFDFSDNGLDIYGNYSYPMLIVGWTTIHPNFDLYLSLPFGEVSTSFEEQQYTISPAGPTVSLMFSL